MYKKSRNVSLIKHKFMTNTTESSRQKLYTDSKIMNESG